MKNKKQKWLKFWQRPLFIANKMFNKEVRIRFLVIESEAVSF